MGAFDRAGGVGVGGSNPLVPTKITKHLQWVMRAAKAARFCVYTAHKQTVSYAADARGFAHPFHTPFASSGGRGSVGEAIGSRPRLRTH